ncbi:class I SAM-dependent methyltransferase [Shewanella seohaensis]|uniref:class I SAM-dependent methyltransferase n=1 Tax=Shewanella seohaensis TaxID=755175 RepID=UPI00200BF8B0|nr:class I SAM-dependent methyltransferase [Shewanella seohaensis]MCL1120828.1 class I SAM-dependent methyltransferase [Shewanella seohaensis]UXM82703.1 class I SAM-dependent methyltransferase [Shewanella seohaensis]
MNTCPLCHSADLVAYHQDKRRRYQQCQQCALVSVPAEFYLSPEAEKAEYDKHENHPQDLGYQQFLDRTLAPLLSRFAPTALGLDFGCGEGKALSLLAQTRGYRVENYDLYYANHPELLTRQYDFVTLTEVIEHVSDADALLTLLNTLLKPKGILAVMTKRVLNPTAFSTWHYKNDPTHINFYSEATFQWLAEHYGWQLEIIDKDVVFLHQAN